MKIKAILGILGIGALTSILVITNPNQDRYNRFAADTLEAEVRSAFCQANELDGWLGDLGKTLGNICEAALDQGKLIGQDDVEKFIEDNTARQNFVLFSLYTTEVTAVRVRSFGIFNRFIPIQKQVG